MSTSTPSLAPGGKKPLNISLIGGLLGVLAAVIIELLPLGGGLPVAGHHMLAILAFAVIVWISEAMDYTVSSILISALIIFLVGSAPDMADPSKVIGTQKALKLALGGFSNSGLALVAAALFIAAAMTVTGLDRRIALFTMSHIGAGGKRVLIGSIVVTILLSFIVPSATARTACVVPIMLGGIASLKLDKKGPLAASIMITIAQATSIWNIGILTSAAQNLLSRGFVEKAFGAEHALTWIDWFIAGAPWAIAMSVVLFFVVRRVLPPEIETIPGGKQAMADSYAALGPMSGAEKRLLTLSLVLLGLWATEGKLHNLDTASTTIGGIALMLLPGVGVMSWSEAQKRIPWGTVLVFGVGISLGTALLDTKAAAWLSTFVVQMFHLDTLSAFGIFAVLSAFLILIHLGFASATALTAALLPILISVLTSLPGPINAAGITMLLAFTVSFGFVLPVNAPQNMVCLGTETFTTRQFTLVGLWLTGIGYLMLLLFALTWWPLLGLI
ncbi:DASS family sodium-coupled anion symporter [Azospira inquinata]|uniref:DASS family sodium-coupled anion symporter n=1 Tax=Azospira inquinata TaxID=2785627 RepID=A0A975XUC5_9RHOO|nr:DASS family sodium-coupled anion symporter [Azospira inquinata]QWT46009.1 DASS family sodium-coupled anion symporter [Azospira inquinata]QWT48663.1 DASS family sodium-coupled anion symporter [Azospira inquinata]